MTTMRSRPKPAPKRKPATKRKPASKKLGSLEHWLLDTGQFGFHKIRPKPKPKRKPLAKLPTAQILYQGRVLGAVPVRPVEVEETNDDNYF